MSQLVLDLSKTLELNLTKSGITDIPILETRLAVDKSGSMDALYKQGWVNYAVDLFIAAALKFDDNQSLEMLFFDSDVTITPEATISDAGSYMKGKGRSIYASGGTDFAPILLAMDSSYNKPVTKVKPKKGFFSGLVSSLFGDNDSDESGNRVADHCGYLGIITDGDNSDRDEVDYWLSHRSSGDTFIQIIGIGNGVNVSYLTSLSKQYSQVAFFHLSNPKAVTGEEFYEQICNEKFVNWIEYHKHKGDF